MTSLTLPPESIGKMRPINIMRDLPKIADLVELCFHKNMNAEGHRYVQQMRDGSKNNRYMQWASSSMPMLGYVWEVDNEIVGNISIVPFRKGNFLLANIAVHPKHRRRGIARKLTQHGMQHIREHNGKTIWLHVEEDNAAAIQLYASLGFQGQALRTTWETDIDTPPPPKQKNIQVTTQTGRFWQQQIGWLNQAYPPAVTWYRMPDFQIFKPGLKYWLYRVFVESDIRQWAIQKDGIPQALLSWMSLHTRRTPLWLAATPQADAASLTALLLHARLQLFPRQKELYIDYPAGEHIAAFEQAGFHAQRTLRWMSAPGNS